MLRVVSYCTSSLFSTYPGQFIPSVALSARELCMLWLVYLIDIPVN